MSWLTSWFQRAMTYNLPCPSYTRWLLRTYLPLLPLSPKTQRLDHWAHPHWHCWQKQGPAPWRAGPVVKPARQKPSTPILVWLGKPSRIPASWVTFLCCFHILCVYKYIYASNGGEDLHLSKLSIKGNQQYEGWLCIAIMLSNIQDINIFRYFWLKMKFNIPWLWSKLLYRVQLQWDFLCKFQIIIQCEINR